MKKKIITIIIVLFVCGIATTVGTYSYLKSPKYTFKQIRNSFENHDWEKFNQYVDVDSIYTSLMNTSDMDSFASGLEAMTRDNLKSAFIDNLKSTIEGTPGDSLSSLSLVSILGADEKSYKFNRIKKKKEGKLLNTDLPMKTWFNFYVDVTYKFRNESWKYKLIGYDNKKYEETSDELYDLISDFYTLPLKEKMEKSISVKIIKKYKGCAEWGYRICLEDILMMPTTITNNTDKDITEVIYYIYPNNYYLITDKYGRFESAENIKSKESITIGTDKGRKYNQFDDEDKTYMNADLESISVKINEIKFSDGQVLEEKYKFENIEQFKKEFPEATYDTFLKILAIRAKYGLVDADDLKSKYEPYVISN